MSHRGDREMVSRAFAAVDSYLGIPYSNDMDVVKRGTQLQQGLGDPNFYPDIQNYNVPLLKNTRVIERPADQDGITQRCTLKAFHFITENKNKPFFLYLAHSMPHITHFCFGGIPGKGTRTVPRRAGRERLGLGEIL